MNQRGKRQRLLNFPVTEDFIAKINAGVAKSGAGDRSKFIRDAIREKLEKMGIEVPVYLWAARSRLVSELAEESASYHVTETPAAAAQKPPVKPSKKTPKTQPS